MNLKAYPIYIRRGYLPGEKTAMQLHEATGRPVVMISGDPKECVLDTFESLRVKIAGQVAGDVFSGHIKLAAETGKIAADSPDDVVKEVAKSSLEIADAIIAESMKGKDGS